MVVKSDIPVGTQFTPDLIDLQAFVKMIIERSGDADAIVDAVVSPPVRLKPYATPPTPRQSKLPVEAAIQYGLLDKSRNPTGLAFELVDLNHADMYAAFARHILLKLNGLRLVEIAQQMAFEGLVVTGDLLAEYATRQGLRIVVHNTAINSLRMWLAKAGVFEGKWTVNSEMKQKLLRLSDNQIAGISSLSHEQRAFLGALCRTGPVFNQKASSIRDMAESESGLTLRRDNLVKNFLAPLQSLGLVEYETKGTSGGKSSTFSTTNQFEAEAVSAFLDHAVASLDPTITEYFRQRPADILANLQTDDTVVRGEALEAFSVMILRLMGLRFIGWQKRAADSVDQSKTEVLIGGLVGGLPTRWLLECWNSPDLALDISDIEESVERFTQSSLSHLLLFSTGGFAPKAKSFVEETIKTNLSTVFLFDNSHFDRLGQDPASFPALLRKQGEQIMQSHGFHVNWQP